MSETSGQCYSGWCTASWGEAKLSYTDTIGPITHTPRQEKLMVDIDPKEDLPDEFKCVLFEYDSDGGDNYYPCGSIKVDETKWKPTGRGHDQPLVWVFEGDSNLGKSTLGASMKGLKVYETDQADSLLDEIVYAQIIVLGNKHSYTISEIINKFKSFNLKPKVICVNFDVASS